MAERQLTARARGEQLLASALAGAGAPPSTELASSLVRVLEREGILLVDERVRPPIGSRRGRRRPVAAAPSDGLGPPRGTRQRSTLCLRCRHPDHLGVCGVLAERAPEVARCRCRA